MSAISSIEIKDFQSHRSTVLEPAPAGQLTVIVGPSDSGKTAIIRSLRWLFYNTPQGTDFINVKATAAGVSVTLAGGHQVTRERSRKSFNRYLVDDQRFEGFGSAVPAEVQEATGIRPVVIGDLELNLNLAEQLDGPFMGRSVSAGARAKALGKLAGTEEVDYAARQLNTDLYRRRQEEKGLAAEVDRLREDLKEYDYLPDLEKLIGQIENLLAGIRRNTERKKQLEVLLARYRSCKEQISQCNDKIESIGRLLGDTEHMVSEANNAAYRHQILISLRGRFIDTERDLAVTRATISATSGVPGACMLITGAARKADTLARLEKYRASLVSVNLGLDRARVVIEATAAVSQAFDTLAGASHKLISMNKLLFCRQGINNVNDGLARAGRVLAGAVNLSKAISIATRAVNDIARVAKLKIFHVEYRELAERLKIIEVKLGQLEGLQGAKSCLGAALSASAKLARLARYRELLAQKRREISQQGLKAGQFAKDEDTYRQAYKQLLAQAGVCPTCKSRITEECLREVV